MSEEQVRVRLSIDSGPDGDEEEVSELTRQLRREFEEIRGLDTCEIEDVSAGMAPARAKGDPATLGALLMTLLASGGVLVTLINAIQFWLTRRDRVSVTVEVGGDKLALTGVSSEQQQQLIEVFLSRHKGQ
jgi:hypothetical protein